MHLHFKFTYLKILVIYLLTLDGLKEYPNLLSFFIATMPTVPTLTDFLIFSHIYALFLCVVSYTRSTLQAISFRSKNVSLISTSKYYTI